MSYIDTIAWYFLLIASIATGAALLKAVALQWSKRRTLAQINAAREAILSHLAGLADIGCSMVNKRSIVKSLRAIGGNEHYDILISAIGSSTACIALQVEEHVDLRHDLRASLFARFFAVNATMLGLAGTVSGMMQAFAGISASHGGGPNAMAAVPGITTSLRYTLWGITIAVFASLSVFLICSALHSIGKSLKLACHVVAEHAAEAISSPAAPREQRMSSPNPRPKVSDPHLHQINTNHATAPGHEPEHSRKLAVIQAAQ